MNEELRLPGGGRVVSCLHGSRLALSCFLSALIAVVSLTAAFVLRFEFSAVDQAVGIWQTWWARSLPLAVMARVAAAAAFRLHRGSWRFASVGDVPAIAGAALVGSIAFAVQVAVVFEGDFPVSVVALDALLGALLLAGIRFFRRLRDVVELRYRTDSRLRALIIGAGEAGDLTVRAMLTPGMLPYRPVGLLDDDPGKRGSTINGVPILGRVADAVGAARKVRADVIVFALPAAETRHLYRVVKEARRTGLPLKTIPDLRELRRDGEMVTRVSDFRIEDLLDRRPHDTDVPQVKRLVEGKVVLVTGAAGSIGSELCRQIAEQNVTTLICVDRDENGLFRLEEELRRRALEDERRPQLSFFLGDVRDQGRMEVVFGRHRPDVVFHAAAYKHVPILQHHPIEAIRNNVGGTRVLVGMAERHRVGTFVLISTDKAVNPTSVMGASKRIAERIVRARDRRSPCRFCTIRFGNVLDSNGSVVETFRRQIRRGGPVTVTHKDIERFFMTIPEAVSLVLFAAAMGEGGEVFILDMGAPVKIDCLARNMIRLSGLEPGRDISITYTGLRPGEKLYEELWTEGERPHPTHHEGIMVAPSTEALPDRLENDVVRLLNGCADNDLNAVWESLLLLVPSFRGRTNGQAHLPPETPDFASIGEHVVSGSE